jgi:putative N6-adenine-specific DNA methylase
MQVALKVKDALADAFRDACGERPNVDTRDPDIRIAVRILGPELEISLNTTGEALTHHGYREESTEAPLRESVAAGLLRYTGFAAFARELGSGNLSHYERPGATEGPAGGEGTSSPKARRIPARIPWDAVVCDPMCGSGTFLIEAALLLLNRKPGSRREDFAVLKLRKGAQLARTLASVQEKLISRERSVPEVHALALSYMRLRGMEWEEARPFLIGYDTDARAITSARGNAAAAGVGKLVTFEKRDATRCAPPASGGLCIVNPPYGERLGVKETLPELYSSLGDQWKKEYQGWMCWLLSGNPEVAKSVGLRPTRKISVFNGNIPCAFQQYIIY